MSNATDAGSDRRLPGKKLLVPAIVFVVVAVAAVAGLFPIRRGYRPPSVDRIGNTALHLAAWEGDAEAVELLLNRGADADAANEFGKTPLRIAVRSGNHKVAEHLLNSGASVVGMNTRDMRTGLGRGGNDLAWVLIDHDLFPDDVKPVDLELALLTGNSGFALVLIQGGVPLKPEESTGYSMLHLAVLHPENAAAVKLLAEKGVDLNAVGRWLPRTQESGTPLSIAIVRGNWEIAKILLDAGADASAKGDRRNDLVVRAVQARRADILQPLIQAGADPDVYSHEYKGEPLVLAIGNRDDRSAKALLEAGADPSKEHWYGKKVAELLAGSDKTELMELLLDPANPKRMNVMGKHFLDEAMRTDNVSVAKRVFTSCFKGPDGQKYRNEWPLVTEAAKSGQREIVELMVAHDWYFRTEAFALALEKDWDDVAKMMIAKWKDRSDGGNWTTGIIEVASKLGKKEYVQFLLKLTPPDARLNSAHREAVKAEHTEIAAMLKLHIENWWKRERDRQRRFREAVLAGKVDRIRALCDEGLKVSGVWVRDTVALAAERGTPEVLTFILSSKGLDPDQKDNDGNSLLHHAVKGGRIANVALLLAKGADTEAQNRARELPLTMAVRSRNVEAVKLLLKHGAEVDFPDGKPNGLAFALERHADQEDIMDVIVTEALENKMLLHKAVALGCRDIVAVMLAKGADPNTRDIRGATPVHHAGRTEILKLLVEYKADLKKRDHRGKTALHWWVNPVSQDRASYLLSNGLDVNAVDRDGNTPLHAATMARAYEAVKSLCKHKADVNAKNKAGETPIALATKRYGLYSGNRHIVGILIEHGATPSEKIRRMLEADAAKRAQTRKIELERLKTLLDGGADVNALDHHFRTRLQAAADESRLDIVELLLSRGASVNDSRSGRMTALTYAVWRNNIKIVNLLLAKGADVNAAADWGKTPLHYAAEGNHKAIALVLLAKGASVKARDERGRTPLVAAAEEDARDMIDLLMTHAAPTADEPKDAVLILGWAVRHGNMKLAQKMHALGAGWLTGDKHGVTPVHRAAQGGQQKLVAFLLEKGANVNVRTRFGVTPISMAARRGQRDMVLFLLEKGADINLNGTGREAGTPLTWAVCNGDIELVKTLLAKGAKTEPRDCFGRTALHCAAGLDKEKIARVLLDNGAAVNGLDARGRTPLDTATTGPRKMVKVLLIERGGKHSRDLKKKP